MMRARVVASMLEQLTPDELAMVGAAWFARLPEVAKSDPHAAGTLAAAMYGHLAAYRPESPAPLDAGFAPTEVARDPRSTP